jgi:hypothetical protein
MMASLPRRRSAWNWSTRCKWFTSILGMASVEVLVEHWRYRVLVVKVRCEFRSRHWQIELREDHFLQVRTIDDFPR